MSLEKWFEENKRKFPWRVDRTPYRVWISEVMLQQTRASVVVPYFLRWMELFPNVKALYMASIDDVIKAWEGLGFYRRARNLHKAAKIIVEEFDGEFPSSRDELLSIGGFGPYTTGALLTFAFQKKEVAIDGNVVRVISRYFCIEQDVQKAKTKKQIEQKTRELLCAKRPWVTSEALIELGATICTPKPKCELCPLQTSCLGKHIADELPKKPKESPIEHIFRQVHVIVKDGSVLVKKGLLGKVMEGLYEFPYIEGPKVKMQHLEGAKKLTPCSHTFTKYKAHLFPFFTREEKKHSGCEWVKISHLSKLPFSSGHRKILTEVLKSDKLLS